MNKTSIMHMPALSATALDERSEEFEKVQAIREHIAEFVEAVFEQCHEQAKYIDVQRSGAIVDLGIDGFRFRMLPMYIGKSNTE